MWPSVSESFGVLFVGLVENGLTVLVDTGSSSNVTVSRGYEPDTGVVVFMVVPLNKFVAVAGSVGYRCESARPIGPVFQCFESGFGVRVIV